MRACSVQKQQESECSSERQNAWRAVVCLVYKKRREYVMQQRKKCAKEVWRRRTAGSSAARARVEVKTAKSRPSPERALPPLWFCFSQCFVTVTVCSFLLLQMPRHAAIYHKPDAANAAIYES